MHLVSLSSAYLHGDAKKLLLRLQSDFTADSNISCFNNMYYMSDLFQVLKGWITMV